MEKLWDNLGYLVLVGLILGQIFIGFNFVIGEAVYVVTDILILGRDFALRRPVSDKIKNGTLTILAGIALVAHV